MTQSLVQPAKPTILDGQDYTPLSYLDTYFVPINTIITLEGILDHDKFIDSLAKVLAQYPHICGQFCRPTATNAGEMRLLLINQSIPVTWKETSTPLDLSKWQDYIPLIETTKIRGGKQVPLMKVAVTISKSTNTSHIGISFSHLLGDASSYFYFVKSWSEIYSMGSMDNPPYLNRITFQKLTDTPAPSAKSIPRTLPGRSQILAITMKERTSVYLPLLKTIIFKRLEKCTFNISSLSLAVLKALNKDNPTCSTQDCFKAYLLKALNRYVYCKLSPFPRITRVATLLNARTYNSVPATYFGNCLTISHTPHHPASSSLSDIAASIRAELKAFSPANLISGQKWMADIQRTNNLLNLAPYFDPETLYANDITKVPFQDLEFGLMQKEFAHLLTVEALPVRNWCMMYSTAVRGKEMERGYEVQIVVPRNCGEKLRKGVERDVGEGFVEYFDRE